MHIPVAAETHQARWWATLTRQQSLIKIVWIYRLNESRIHKQLVSSLKQRWGLQHRGAVAWNKNNEPQTVPMFHTMQCKKLSI